jgi:hypothetical protein
VASYFHDDFDDLGERPAAQVVTVVETAVRERSSENRDESGDEASRWYPWPLRQVTVVLKPCFSLVETADSHALLALRNAVSCDALTLIGVPVSSPLRPVGSAPCPLRQLVIAFRPDRRAPGDDADSVAECLDEHPAVSTSPAAIVAASVVVFQVLRTRVSRGRSSMSRPT